LYLNVYAPSTPAPPGGRAVLFWIYGGSLEFGTAMQPAYDGSAFAAYQDVIVVAPNYRTNVFGFPNSPELPVTGQNLGFLDQRFALDWVQSNIHAFGGDPEQVTIFGESAGAFSIDALLTSFPKNSTPPFRGAILESGQISYRAAPEAPSTPSWDALAAALDCTGTSNLTCIRAAPALSIKSIIEHQALVFNPVADNVTLVSNPAQARLSGNIAHIPVLSGTNAQEGRVFEVGQSNITQFVETTFGKVLGLPEQVLASYPVGGAEFPTDYDAISQIVTEVTFQCSDALFANATASVGIPSWRYYYNASFPDAEPYDFLGVYHSSEIPQVFGSYLLTNPLVGPTVQEYALSSFMNGAWAKFAKNPAGGPGWNAIGSGGSYYLGASGQDLGVLGNVGNTNGSGVTVISEYGVDFRCDLYKPLYSAISRVQIP
jgi:carboxylesterase type B